MFFLQSSKKICDIKTLKRFTRGSNSNERAKHCWRDGGFFYSFLSLAWHTFWHSLTRRLFERSSADINTFERLTQLRCESLCARNICNPPAHVDGIVAEKKKNRSNTKADSLDETFIIKSCINSLHKFSFSFFPFIAQKHLVKLAYNYTSIIWI